MYSGVCREFVCNVIYSLVVKYFERCLYVDIFDVI